MWQRLLVWLVFAATPAWLLGADPPAMLYGKGIVLRNGTAIPDSSTVFPGDLVETTADSVATLNRAGSSVVILPNSVVVFQGESISVEHGGIRVATSDAISAHVRCLMIVPLTSAPTQFEITDANGTVEIAAKKNDVRIEGTAALKKAADSQSTNILHEGEETKRDESDGCKTGKPNVDHGAAPAAYRNIFNVKEVAIVGIAGLGIWLALQNDDPPSPWKP